MIIKYAVLFELGLFLFCFAFKEFFQHLGILSECFGWINIIDPMKFLQNIRPEYTPDGTCSYLEKIKMIEPTLVVPVLSLQEGCTLEFRVDGIG